MDRRHIHDPVHACRKYRIMGRDDQCPALCQLQQVIRDESSRFPVEMRGRLIGQNKLRCRIGESARYGEPHRLPARNAISAVSDLQMPARLRQSIQSGAVQDLFHHGLADRQAAKTNIRLHGRGKKNGF